MIIGLESDNLLATGTVLTSALAFDPSLPAANMFNPDMRRLARLVGQFNVDATRNKVDGTNGGGAWVATLATAIYYGPTAFAQEVARACAAAHGATVRCVWLQGQVAGITPPTHVFLLTFTGASTLDTATGPNTAVSALRWLGGYRNQDRASDTSHAGDFAVIHGPDDRVAVDLGAAKGAHASFLVRPDFSPAARVYVLANPASDFSGSGARYEFKDSAHSKLMATFFPAGSAQYRYVALHIQDPQREDRASTELGYWWYGPVLDTDRASDWARIEWEATSYARNLTIRRSETPGIRGQPFLAGMEPGEHFKVAFQSAPGIAPGSEDAVRDTLRRLGTAGLAFVAFKPTTDPHRETALCRITPSDLGRALGGDGDGRLSVSFDCEVQAVA